MAIVKPLYGHTSPETAYVVEDYPYGFKLRTTIRYWLERSPNRGVRFVSQTQNPKRGNVWNKPKASTYAAFAGGMYLDENGHVHWSGIGEYSTDEQIRSFLESFPEADFPDLQALIAAKLKYIRGILDGKIHWTMNGVRMPFTESDRELKTKELVFWEAMLDKHS